MTVTHWNPPPRDSALEARAVGAQSGVTNGSAVRPQCYHIHAHLLSHCWQLRNIMLAGRYRGASPAKWQCCDQTGLTRRKDQVISVKLGTAPWPQHIWGPLKITFYPPTAFVCSVVFWELTLIISLNNINRFVLVTGTQLIWYSFGIIRIAEWAKLPAFGNTTMPLSFRVKYLTLMIKTLGFLGMSVTASLHDVTSLKSWIYMLLNPHTSQVR